MSITNSPSVVTSGLVFACDMSNRRSYQGPPITNLCTGISFAGGGTAAGYVCTNQTETVNIPQLGPTTVYTSYIQNNYSAVSTNCCPSLFQYGTWPVSGSTLYTYAIVYRCDSEYTGANFMYRYEYGGAGYITELGVHSNSQRQYLGDGWWWAWATSTTQSAATTIQSSGLWYYQYSTVPDRISVAKVLFTAGNYSNLHPKYWPAMGTTRTTTQAVVDLTGRTTLTATGLTYASDGSPSFSGTAPNVINNTSSTLFNRVNGESMTVVAWIKPSRNAGQYQDIVVNRSDAYYNWMLYQHTTDGAISFHGSSQNKSSYIPTLNTWVCIVATAVGSGNLLLYANGVLQQTVPGYTYNIATPSNFSIGMFGTSSEPYQGSIGMAQVYNRVLSAAEVLQNFNAQRTRYGI